MIAPAGAAYAYLPLLADTAQVVLLQASGHSALLVNGEPRVGDPYGNGSVRLPIALRAGVNDLLFIGGRGAITASLGPARGTAALDQADLTLPDLVAGEPVDAWAAILVRNQTQEQLAGLVIEAELDGSPAIQTDLPALLPISVRKCAFRLSSQARESTGTIPVEVRLIRREGREVIDRQRLELVVVGEGATRRRTFRSAIDGSVQYFAHVPALPSEHAPGLMLTLHGAGVEGSGQAACYTRKPGLHIVAPTNRRPFGFDWEDWGRLDALEVLELARNLLKTDPKRTYVSGHSMGRHGTWHLGVTYPDRFAAIAPSAGWISFATYTNRGQAEGPPERELMQRGASSSDTLSLARNLSRTGVYILHGDADDNVPVSEARAMRQVLATFHPDFAYHEQPGAGHWWGNSCVDWPPLIAFLSERSLPEPGEVTQVSFATMNPGISAESHWLRLEAQARPLMLSRAEIHCDSENRVFTGTTQNVAAFSLDVNHLAPGGAIRVKLDGQDLGMVEWPARDRRIPLARVAERWQVAGPRPSGHKGLHRNGPFKSAFQNRFLLVYGTSGTPEEKAWSLAKARFDAEQFWYRGNGSVDVMSDAEYLDTGDPSRHVVIYGHSDMNRAWNALLDSAPIQARRGSIRVGARLLEAENLGFLFAYPRKGSDHAMVAAIGGTGPAGFHLTDRMPYFTSGVGFADWALVDAAGLRGCGYFANDWGLTAGESAWRD
jgi:pimeloyl-ACP methyl ester carboxylesterase